jgi:hypothetical protein
VRTTTCLLTGIALLAAAALLAGACGSSDDTESTPAGTTAPSAETSPSGESDVLDRLPKVPEAIESTRPPESPDGMGGEAFLTDVFDDVQAMWRHEFEAAGARYTPATLTIFRDEVQTGCGTESVKTRAPPASSSATSRRPTSWPTRSPITCSCCSGSCSG